MPFYPKRGQRPNRRSRGVDSVEDVLEERLDFGHTGRATDEDDVVDVFLLRAGVLQHLLDGL